MLEFEGLPYYTWEIIYDLKDGLVTNQLYRSLGFGSLRYVFSWGGAQIAFKDTKELQQPLNIGLTGICSLENGLQDLKGQRLGYRIH